MKEDCIKRVFFFNKIVKKLCEFLMYWVDGVLRWSVNEGYIIGKLNLFFWGV